MGATTTDKLNEIEATRARLDDDLRVLQSRLPDRQELTDQARAYAGQYGPQVGAGLAAVGVTGLVTRRAARKRRLRKTAQRQAEAFASVLPDVLPDVLPEAIPVEATVEHRSSRTGPVALVASVAALGLSAWNWWQRNDVRSTDELVPAVRADAGLD